MMILPITDDFSYFRGLVDIFGISRGEITQVNFPNMKTFPKHKKFPISNFKIFMEINCKETLIPTLQLNPRKIINQNQLNHKNPLPTIE